MVGRLGSSVFSTEYRYTLDRPQTRQTLKKEGTSAAIRALDHPLIFMFQMNCRPKHPWSPWPHRWTGSMGPNPAPRIGFGAPGVEAAALAQFGSFILLERSNGQEGMLRLRCC